MFVISIIGGGCASPSGDDQPETADHAITEEHSRYVEFAARNGVRPRRDRPLVIGVRGRNVNGNVHPTRIAKVFDDTLIVLTTTREVIRLAASTHPWETTATAEDDVSDVDGDSKPDVGMIRPGIYLATRREA